MSYEEQISPEFAKKQLKYEALTILNEFKTLAIERDHSVSEKDRIFKLFKLLSIIIELI